MLMKRICLAISFLLIAVMSFAQSARVFTISTTDFSRIAGTPRVVSDPAHDQWVIGWRQQAGPPKIIARTLSGSGVLGAVQTLVSGVTAFSDNFDIVRDTNRGMYLVTFERGQGLFVQLFDSTLTSSGSAILVEPGAKNCSPVVVNDESGDRYLLVYLAGLDGIQRRVIKTRVIGFDSRPQSAATVVATAPTGTIYRSLSLARNSTTGSILAMALEGSSSAGALKGFALRPDGKLIRSSALIFNDSTTSLNTRAGSAFTTTGSGVGIWNNQQSIEFRKLTGALNFGGPAKVIPNAADEDSRQVGIAFDVAKKRFIGAWAVADRIKAIALSAAGSASKPPFDVATSTLTYARNAFVSAGLVNGSVVVVWEDSSNSAADKTASKFRIRAALLN